MNETLKNQPAIITAKDILGGTLGMRHHAGNIAGGVTDAGNVAKRAIGVGIVC